MTDVLAAMGRWFSRPVPRPDAELRLFCLPYAGAGVATFRPWAKDLPDDVELCLVNIPGRDARMHETPHSSVDSLLTELSEAILPLLDRPFALFGHSMGALLAYTLTRKIEQEYQLQPRHLFISARRAPQVPDPDPPLHKLSDAAFVVGMIRRYNGIPKALLTDIDLLKLFLPTIRADMTMIETYRCSESAALRNPVTAFGGWDDERVTETDLTAWQDLTTGPFMLQMFHGGHFYIHDQRAELLQAITDGLAGAAHRTVRAAAEHRRPRATSIPAALQMTGSEG